MYLTWRIQLPKSSNCLRLLSEMLWSLPLSPISWVAFLGHATLSVVYGQEAPGDGKVLRHQNTIFSDSIRERVNCKLYLVLIMSQLFVQDSRVDHFSSMASFVASCFNVVFCSWNVIVIYKCVSFYMICFI